MKTLLALPLVLGTFAAAGSDYTLHTFKKVQLSDQFWSEGANFGDLNNDGQNDIISGPWWWEGPDFKKRHEIYAPTAKFTTWLYRLAHNRWIDQVRAEGHLTLVYADDEAQRDAVEIEAVSAVGHLVVRRARDEIELSCGQDVAC